MDRICLNFLNGYSCGSCYTRMVLHPGLGLKYGVIIIIIIIIIISGLDSQGFFLKSLINLQLLVLQKPKKTYFGAQDLMLKRLELIFSCIFHIFSYIFTYPLPQNLHFLIFLDSTGLNSRPSPGAGARHQLGGDGERDSRQRHQRAGRGEHVSTKKHLRWGYVYSYSLRKT